MKFDILTLFPNMFSSPFQEGIIGKAIKKGIIEIRTVNIRDFSLDKHKSVDDTPYGGGHGMVMKVEPIVRAIRWIKAQDPSCWTIYLSPQGKLLDQKKVEELSKRSHIVLLCGRYEGVDERVREFYIDEEISIGDYILTGGELAAMILIDTISRFIPGVLGAQESVKEDSFSNFLLEYPQYTRPFEFEGHQVPEILISGNHSAIINWRRKEAIKRTFIKRPDLLLKATLTEEEKELLKELMGKDPSQGNSEIND